MKVRPSFSLLTNWAKWKRCATASPFSTRANSRSKVQWPSWFGGIVSTSNNFSLRSSATKLVPKPTLDYYEKHSRSFHHRHQRAVPPEGLLRPLHPYGAHLFGHGLRPHLQRQ